MKSDTIRNYLCGAAQQLRYAQVLYIDMYDKSKIINSRAESGNIKAMKWAHANGWKWNDWTCAEAAYGYIVKAVPMTRGHV